MPLLFLSHAGVDSDEARKLARRVREAPAARAVGLEVWFDQDDLQAGRPWQKQIEDALHRSSAFAVYVGSRGFANWVDAEVRFALNRAVADSSYKFVPVLSPNAPAMHSLPGFVQQFQGVTADGESVEWFERLMAAVLGPSEQPLLLESEPFFGLRAVDEARSHLFFGRERETREVIEKLQRAPLVMVVGDSGSGKSSLVRAGVVPSYRGGALTTLVVDQPGEQIWHVVAIQPRSAPRSALSEAVYQLGGPLGLAEETRGTYAKWAKSEDLDEVIRALRCGLPSEHAYLLLFVDQFEELWTSTAKTERESFLDLLMGLAERDEARLRIVLTMRQDYVNLCSEHRGLQQWLEKNHRLARYDLRRMDDASLRRVITEPLRLAGIDEDERESLATLITREIGERAGDLALVQMALTEAWRARAAHGGDLHQAYISVGSVEGALALASEKIRSQFHDAPERDTLDGILIRLVQLGDTGGATRRVATRDEFDNDRWTMVQTLASEKGKRLVVLGGEWHASTAEIAHEALVTAWPHFQRILQESAQQKRTFDRLIQRVKGWRAAPVSKQGAHLASGAELETFEALLRARASWLSREERAYVESSCRSAERRRQRTKLITRTILTLGILASSLAAAATWFGFAALEAKTRADVTAAQVLSETGRQALELGQPGRAAVYLNEALRLNSRDIAARSLLPEATRTISMLKATLEGHASHVTAISFSPDGTRICTVSDDGTAKLWDASDGKLVTTLESHLHQVSAPSFSPDSARLVTTHDNTVRIWDARSGKPLAAALEGHSSIVRAAAFSPDGVRIITAGDDAAAKLWDTNTGKLLSTLEGHTYSLRVAAFSPDGARIVTADDHSQARLWEANTGQVIATFERASTASFSPDSARIVTTINESVAKLWDARNGKPLGTLDSGSAVTTASFSPDGAEVVTGSDDRRAKRWDANTGKVLAVFEGHFDIIRYASFSPDATRVVTTSSDHTAKLWEAKTGKLLATLEGHSDIVRHASFSPDGAFIATASDDHTVKLWHANSGKLVTALKGHATDVRVANFSPDGTRAVTASGDHTVRVWNVDSGKLLSTLDGRSPNPWVAVFSPDSARIVTASWEPGAKLWDATTGKLLATLKPSSDNADDSNLAVRSASFSPNGTRIVTAGNDGTAKVWDALSGRLLTTCKGHSDTVWSVSFSPDGTRILTASADRTAKLFSTTSGDELTEFKGHAKSVNAASFSSESARVVTASDDHTSKIWDAKSGELLSTLEGHTDIVKTATFSPDGASIVTASPDRTAKLWDAKSGKLVTTLEGRSNQVWGAAFSPDGERIVTADGTARLWDAKSGKLVTTLEGYPFVVWGAAFSPDGGRIVTSGGATSALWDVHLETRAASAIAALLEKRVPWKLDHGVLVPRLGAHP